MDKQISVFKYKGILFNYEKKESTDPCNNMNEPQKQYGKWNKLDTRGNILYDSICVKYLEGL